MARPPKPWYRKERRAWFVTLDGVQHNLGPDQALALSRFAKLLAQFAGDRCQLPDTFAELADAFLEWTQRNRSEATYLWYLKALQSFVRRYPDVKPEQLRPFHVETWAAEHGGATNTRRNRMRAVKRCLRWAHRQGYIDRDPVVALEVPNGPPRDVYVSPEEFAELLSHVKCPEFADLLTVVYEVGCRPQEILRLEPRHVDLKHSRWVIPASEAKGKRAPRVVYLTEKAQAITERYLARYPGGKLFCNSQGLPWDPYSTACHARRVQLRMGRARMKARGITVPDHEVVELAVQLADDKRRKEDERLTNAGKRPKRRPRLNTPKTDTYWTRVARQRLVDKRASELAERRSLYSLRHSWATNALQSGVDPLTAAVLMGHRDPSMLARVYQHLSHNPEHLLKQMKKARGE
ncbi:site-specific tyrosine recombinase XerC [Posidoniimonas polymericola]|uniref:Site-specific tyrosine recombinase XerC n=1 Tax=Posidoniimonas polymericola TaxID=2528002 RepID=A0A5C5YTY1_9BACT|nr:site-specific integrase [Posidoniimonas polymericola]TWT78418.1 site-specific tyrosine recombinase XerC [Posidoniimonas polymericola]